MKDRWAKRSQPCCVEGGPIAFVLIKRVPRGQIVVKLHQPVSQHLRHNRGAADHVAVLVAADERAAGYGHRWAHRPVDEDEIRRLGEVIDRLSHRRQGGLEDIEMVNLTRTDDAEADIRVLEDGVEGPHALQGGEPFRVVDADGKTGDMQHDSGGHDWSCPRSASGFVELGDPAKTVGAGLDVR